MSLFEKVEETLRVEVVGTDGIRRVGYYPRDVDMVANTYRIDPERVFLTKVKKNAFSTVQQPTIMFRENSSEAIPYRAAASKPSPKEIGDAVSRAAWALSNLIIQKEDKWKIFLLLLCGLAVAAGAGSAYLSYDTGQRLTDFEDRFMSAIDTANPDVTVTPTVTQTVKPTTTLPTPTVATPSGL